MDLGTKLLYLAGARLARRVTDVKILTSVRSSTGIGINMPMTPSDIYKELVDGFQNRKYAAGLLVAFIDMLSHPSLSGSSFSGFDDFLKKHPRREFRSEGKRANTLIVEIEEGKTLGLRPFYNAVETFFRAKNKRFDYPSCAPHATQSWRDYQHWLDALCTFHFDQLAELRKKVCDFVLDALPSQAFDPSSVSREPPLFRMVIESFDLTMHPKEVSGSAYQGLVFGFLRADNPHLQVEIDKVRTGSKRLQRVGDIDAWEGARLALTAEVKQFLIEPEHLDSFENFANEVKGRGSIGIIAALGFAEGVREKIEELGLRAVNLDNLLEIVELWDPMKQRTAVASMVYYVSHVEKNSALKLRLNSFLVDSEKNFGNL
jgi:hypothetical protein